MLPVINRHLSHPLSAGILLASMLGCPLLSSFPLPVLLFSCRSIEPVPRWHQGSFMEVCFASTSHSYSPHPFAHAHARPRSSPDWMALCQPATVIVLICSSSLRCPSPCVYIWIPLSSPYSIHSLFLNNLYIYIRNITYTTFDFFLCMLQIVCLCFHLGDFFFGTWRNALSDWPVGNYCSTNLFHREKRRKTKRALSLEKACGFFN